LSFLGYFYMKHLSFWISSKSPLFLDAIYRSNRACVYFYLSIYMQTDLNSFFSCVYREKYISMLDFKNAPMTRLDTGHLPLSSSSSTPLYCYFNRHQKYIYLHSIIYFLCTTFFRNYSFFFVDIFGKSFAKHLFSCVAIDEIF
jgi:hypothetical protein